MADEHSQVLCLLRQRADIYHIVENPASCLNLDPSSLVSLG